MKRVRAAEALAQLDGLAAVAGSSDPLACASNLSCVLGFLVGDAFFITTVNSSWSACYKTLIADQQSVSNHQHSWNCTSRVAA
jgi:hypothetical protein